MALSSVPWHGEYGSSVRSGNWPDAAARDGASICSNESIANRHTTVGEIPPHRICPARPPVAMAMLHDKSYSNDLFAAERLEVVGADTQQFAIDAIVVMSD